jgi:hypothetical protein
MSDVELVKRLVTGGIYIQRGMTDIWMMEQDLREAAARIKQLAVTNEALTAERDALKQIAADHVLQELEQAARADKAEAKLAKAVEALQAVVQHEASIFWGVDAEKNKRASWRGVMRKIKATLAEIEGEQP